MGWEENKDKNLSFAAAERTGGMFHFRTLGYIMMHVLQWWQMANREVCEFEQMELFRMGTRS